jgi:putative hemolysin
MFRKHLYLIGAGKAGVYATEKCIAHPENRQLLRQELKRAERIGETTDGKSIYLADYDQAPKLIREIGRLREYTFRKVDEGTGSKRDTDRFDIHYRHIVLWDDAELEVVGAYRIGECASILPKHAINGLYMRQLCRFSPAFAEQILPHAIELGRSFVQPRYWGSRALDYLWQGIGAYLRHHPQVHYMYGPVSLSHAYPRAARDALVWFYLHHFKAGGDWMRAMTPYTLSDMTHAEMQQLFAVHDAEQTYEQQFRILKGYLKSLEVSVPTLFKQYGELCEPGGVRFFDFGLDKDFSDCVDGYLLVDVEKIKASKRERYIEKPAV